MLFGLVIATVVMMILLDQTLSINLQTDHSQIQNTWDDSARKVVALPGSRTKHQWREIEIVSDEPGNPTVGV